MSDARPFSRHVLVAVGRAPVGPVLQELLQEAGLGAAQDMRVLGDGHPWHAAEAELGEVPAETLARLRGLLPGIEGADLALLPAAGRRKRLLISDMDSTIIGQECLDELAGFAGLKAEISAITEQAMQGELDFEEALLTRVGKLAGLPVDKVAECYRTRITLNPGARTLVATMAAHGAHCLLVSGGFTAFTSRVAEAAGFHSHRANTLIDDGKVLTGDVGRPILGREAKLVALDEAATALGLARADALALGDGANDLAMIEAAGLGVAFQAKPVVAAKAHAAIRVSDLTAALYFQGYSDAEIISR